MNFALIFLFFISYLRFSEGVLCEVGEALKDPNNPEQDRPCGTGCPGNYNCVVSTVLQFGSICCRNKATICSLPPIAGASCGSTTVQCQKWYYDQASGTCRTFYYNGCLGNLNNFNTQQECLSACRQSTPTNQMCPAGSNPQAGTNVQTPCNMTPFMQCQQGFTCQYSATLQRSYCCSSQLTPSQFCPNGYAAPAGTTTGSTCNGLTGCTPGYTCMQSPSNAQLWYCCTQQNQPSQLLCPQGSTLMQGVTASNPCQPGFACAAQGYSCQRSPFNGYSYCCSNQNTNVVCPQGGQPVMIAGTNQAVSCTNGQGCTAPYTCQSIGVIGGQNVGICCSGGTFSQECPSGYIPYRPQANTVLICNQNGIIQPGMCPQGTNCLWSPTQRTNICCMVGNRIQKKLVISSNQTEPATTAKP